MLEVIGSLNCHNGSTLSPKVKVFYMKIKQLRILALSTALCFIVVALFAAAPTQAAQRVLVLPFKMNAPQDVTYLQQGILDMFASRLENPGNVQVVSKLEAQQAFKRAGGNIDASTAQNLAKQAAANYVLFGSVTVLGNNVSIDAKMAPVTSDGQPLSMFAQAEGMDSVIPKVNQFADEINSKMFGRRNTGGTSVAGGGAAAPVPAPSAGTGDTGPVPAYRRHPESLLTGQEGRNAGNPLNPNFITAVGANQREGKFWRSPSFPAQVIGLCVADVDRDGKNELVYATRSALYIARVAGRGFQRVAMFQGPRGDRFLTLDVADVNGNGIPEIIISAQRRFDARSLVLELKGNKLVTIIKDVPYYLRMVHTPEGMALFGQRSGMGDAFFGGVSYMHYSKDGKSLTEGNPLALPSGYHIFNFSLAVLSAETGEFLVGINKKERLVVRTRGGGSDMWTSDEDFGGTLQFIEMDWADDPERVVKDDRPPPNACIFPPAS